MWLVLCAVVTILFLVYKWLTVNHDYFTKLDLPFAKPTILFGSWSDIILCKKPIPEVINELYKEFPNDKVSGFFEFVKPVFLIRNPKLLKKLAVKDFDYFMDHRKFIDDPLLGRGLFLLTGEEWKDMRATLSPAFTGSKMRQMFELVNIVCQQAAKTLKQQIEDGGTDTFEFKDLAKKFTVDTIATCAFGIEVNSFENPKNDFHQIADKITNNGPFLTKLEFILKFAGIFLMPKVMSAFKVSLFDKQTNNFFKAAISDTMKARVEKDIVRHDMINLLIQAKKGKLIHETEEQIAEGFATVQESQVGKSTVARKWEDDDLTAQCFMFFFAGFDTVSTMLTFMAYELVANPEIQRKLQQEIDELNETLDGKPVNYEQIQSMKFMDQVLSETLRKWPVIPFVDRRCVKDYQVEYTNDNGENKKFNFEKDKLFYIPFYGLHHDERYFTNPEKFDPERFSEERRGEIDPDTYLPFGIGPRNCIGCRFALMEIKAFMFYLLLTFDFNVTEKTRIPLKYACNPAQVQIEGGVWVGFKPRN